MLELIGVEFLADHPGVRVDIEHGLDAGEVQCGERALAGRFFRSTVKGGGEHSQRAFQMHNGAPLPAW
jgi:hypothetical protein